MQKYKIGFEQELECLKGPSMKRFHEEIMSNLFPNIIKEVIRSLIPAKDVKRVDNMEGSKLFDGEQMEGEDGQRESENEEEPSLIFLKKNPFEILQKPKPA